MKAHSFGVVCLRALPVFLTKDRIFCGLPQKYFNFLGLISGVKRKEALHEPSKNKTKNKSKGGEEHD